MCTHFILVPRILRPVAMSKFANESSNFKDQIEDYISPSKSITYRLHPQYIINTKMMTITVSISKKLFLKKKKCFSSIIKLICEKSVKNIYF